MRFSLTCSVSVIAVGGGDGGDGGGGGFVTLLM